jgi:hypothetical protein
VKEWRRRAEKRRKRFNTEFTEQEKREGEEKSGEEQKKRPGVWCPASGSRIGCGGQI